MKHYFIANWKMFHLPDDALQFVSQLSELYKPDARCSVGIAAQYPLIPIIAGPLKEQGLAMLGAQNVHWLDSGAHTGEVSAPLLKKLGAEFVITGHSERRQYYGETDEHVGLRTQNAIKHGLRAFACIGETRHEYEAQETEAVVARQLRSAIAPLEAEDSKLLAIAYEPVWAIGTGLAATPDSANEIHGVIRAELAGHFGEELASQIPILYGGSTKPENIREFMRQPNIDGALVGGASLKVDSFVSLVKNAYS